MQKWVRKTLLLTVLAAFTSGSIKASYESKIIGLIGGCAIIGGIVGLFCKSDASSQEKTSSATVWAMVGTACGGICSLFIERTDQEELDHTRQDYTCAQTLYDSTMREFCSELTLLPTLDEKPFKKIINTKQQHSAYHYLAYVERVQATLQALRDQQSVLSKQIKTLETRNKKLYNHTMDEFDRKNFSQQYEQQLKKTETLCANYGDLINKLKNIAAEAQGLENYQHDLTRKSLDETKDELARVRYERRQEPRVIIHACHHEPDYPHYPDPHHDHYHAHHHAHHSF